MPDTKITALTAIGANPIIPSTFPIPMVDLTDTSMAASGTTKKVTVNQILGAGGTATLASATITGDLTVDTSTLKVDSSANQVGVGITTFTGAQSLQVLTGLRVSNANPETVNCLNFAVTSTTSTIETRYETPLILATSAIERYRISSTGIATWSNVDNVAGTAMTLNSTGLGVGVSPQAKIHIANASMLIDTIYTQNKPQIVLGATGPNFGLIQNDGTGLWSLGYGGSLTSLGTPVLSWNSSGNVGIGVAGPSYRLQANVATGGDRNIFAAQVTGASNGFQVQWNNGTQKLRVNFSDLPTSSAGLPVGTLWIDTTAGNTLKIA